MLAKALRKYADAVNAVHCSLRDGIDESCQLSQKMNDAPELIRVLARIVEGKTIAEAFGAPGDWGYGTPIGNALFQHYNNKTG